MGKYIAAILAASLLGIAITGCAPMAVGQQHEEKEPELQIESQAETQELPAAGFPMLHLQNYINIDRASAWHYQLGREHNGI